MSSRIASHLPSADLLRIALAAARFPRRAPEEDGFTATDIERIAHRFPGFLAGRLVALTAEEGASPGFAAALADWGRRRFADGANEGGPEALAGRIGVTAPAGALTAAALPVLSGLRRRDLPGLAALDAPGPGAVPLSLLFRQLLFAIRLRRPDMLAAVEPNLAAVFDWVVVFGLAEHGLWHLLPPADRRLLLAGTREAPPVFLRAVMRFRPDLRALADRRPLALREWFRAHAVAEYRIRLEEPEPEPPRPGLLSVIGPWRQVLGISDDCFSACRALESLGAEYEVVGTSPARWIEVDPDKLAALRHRAVAAPGGDRALFCDTLFEATFWALRHWPRFLAFRRVDLFAPWELPGLPPGWQAAARLFGTVMSPSRFVQEVFREAGVGRALAVTSSVELVGRPAPAAALTLRRRGLALPRARKVFACLFDFSSYLTRKNPEAVVRAFARLRRQVPNATLVLKTTRGRRSRGAARRLRALLRGVPDVVWADGAWSNAEVEALLHRADAFVSLHRAEGFGRNIAKALLLGRPVVVTDWSGNADMRAEPGYFGVPCRLVPLSDRDYVLGEGQVWAEPDPRGAVRGMRAALGQRLRVQRERTACRFSRERLAHRLGRVLGAVGPSPRR